MNSVTFHDISPVIRSGCPTTQTSLYSVEKNDPNSRHSLTNQFTTMVLQHRSKSGDLKNSLSLAGIHNDLKLNALTLNESGSSNILLAKMSFDCLIDDNTRTFVTFDLRIPGTHKKDEIVFSYDFVQQLYKTKERVYAACRYFFTKGRAVANPSQSKHGHVPEYDPTSSKHDQYIRHTEQLLVAYLGRVEGAQMLQKRLRVEIRSKFPKASQVKVYSAVLHLHSTKSCCAPCENSLVGLMQTKETVQIGDDEIGFLPHFKSACTEDDSILKFTFPDRSSFNLLVTVTATEQDAHHRSPASYKSHLVTKERPLPIHAIDIKDPTSTTRIFSTVFFEKFEIKRVPKITHLSDMSVMISGSKATSGSGGTIKKTEDVREKEFESLRKTFSFLGISPQKKK